MLRAVLFDFGDTLADESTEVKDEHRVTRTADLFPGVPAALRSLHAAGLTLALVADCVAGTGRRSYDNVLAQHGLTDLFAAIVTSDDVGVNKPDPAIFALALGRLGLDPGAVAYVGNRLDRDIEGANRFGMLSIWCRISTRYGAEPANGWQVPDHQFTDYADLPPLILGRIQGRG